MPFKIRSRRNVIVVLCAGIAMLPLAAVGESAENLLLISYDGLRWQELFGGADSRLLESDATKNAEAIKEQFWADSPEERRKRLLPFFWNVLAVEGQVYGSEEQGSPSVVSNGRNFSYPGYNEMLTGAVDDRIDSNAKRNNPNVNVLEWLHGRESFKNKVGAFASWDVFPYIINQERSGVSVNAGWMPLTESPDAAHLAFLNQLAAETPHYWAGVRFDSFTFYGAVEFVKQRGPRVLYVAFGETDDWAHDGRYDLYLESARRTDDYIRRLWELLESMPQYRGKTALLMTTDHGRGDTIKDWTSHGENIAGCERIWVGMMGPGVPAGGIVENRPTTQSQVAATVAALLGHDYIPEGIQPASAIDPSRVSE